MAEQNVNSCPPSFVKITTGFGTWMKCASCSAYLENAEKLCRHLDRVNHDYPAPEWPEWEPIPPELELEQLPESEQWEKWPEEPEDPSNPKPCSSRSCFPNGLAAIPGDPEVNTNQSSSAPAPAPAPSSTSATITGGILQRPSKKVNNDTVAVENDEPYVRPRVMTLADLNRNGRGRARGRGRGRGRGAGGIRGLGQFASLANRHVDEDYQAQKAEESDSDEDSAPARNTRKRGRPRGGKVAAAPKKARGGARGAGARSSPQGAQPDADAPGNDEPVPGPADPSVWNTNGHVLIQADEAAQIPALPTSAEERRRMLAAAAERRLQQDESRGLQDAEAFRLKKQKQEEMERQREELERINFGKGASGSSLRWQMQ